MVGGVAAALREEARRADERRLLVLTGAPEPCFDAAGEAIDAAGIDRGAAVLVGPDPALGLDHLPPERADRLLGTTREAVVIAAHDQLDPNTLGRAVGAVDGGGLLVLACPPLDRWPDRRDGFDETLAVPPFGVESVGGRFRRRLVETLRSHPGIAIYDADAGEALRDGLIRPAPRLGREGTTPPDDAAFPRTAYEACLTGDQVAALRALEALRDPDSAVVIEADRGRGKSSAAGLAAGALAAAGDDVLVTAPGYRNAREVFCRADELLASIGERADGEGDPPRRIESSSGGRVRFLPPPEAVEAEPDALIVDEAAALSVSLLADTLDAGRVAYATTVHGYEGAGRGFAVRFRDRLDASGLDVTDVTMTEPIRYAAGDPVEVWAFRALLLDAAPPADQLIEGARPETVEYRALDPGDLLDDEPLLREAFGLLVLAHYRTEPADLARLLDAPNVSVRALLHDGHVAAVALLAREGDLPADRRAHMYEGGRVRGNMLPDVLTTQLRDEAAGVPVGMRVMRIATHAAARSRGLGSHLLDAVREEFADLDWLGAGYGATPRLIEFWAACGFSTVHLSVTRNRRSGEHSAVMLRPLSEAGRALHDRHARWFARRAVAALPDALSDLDPDVVRAALRATDVDAAPDLSEHDWRHVASAAYGPGMIDVDPRPFRELAAAHLIDPDDPDLLSARQERLLVRKALQARPWGEVADELGFHSRGECMRALGRACRPLVDAYGSQAAHEERDRYAGSGES